MAGWQSGYAAACKAVDGGSIPPSASIFFSTSLISPCRIPLRCLARVAKLVDARDLKSLGLTPCRFDSGPGHHFLSAHDAWPAVMYGFCQLRFYGDDIYPAFLPVARDQSLDPLSLGQVVPVAVAFEVLFHETFDGYFDRYREPAVPAPGIDAVQAGPAAERQCAGLFAAASPCEGVCRRYAFLRAAVPSDSGNIPGYPGRRSSNRRRRTCGSQIVCRCPKGFHAGAITLGMLERLSRRAGARANSP